MRVFFVFVCVFFVFYRINFVCQLKHDKHVKDKSLGFLLCTTDTVEVSQLENRGRTLHRPTRGGTSKPAGRFNFRPAPPHYPLYPSLKGSPSCTLSHVHVPEQHNGYIFKSRLAPFQPYQS